MLMKQSIDRPTVFLTSYPQLGAELVHIYTTLCLPVFVHVLKHQEKQETFFGIFYLSFLQFESSKQLCVSVLK